MNRSARSTSGEKNVKVRTARSEETWQTATKPCKRVTPSGEIHSSIYIVPQVHIPVTFVSTLTHKIDGSKVPQSFRNIKWIKNKIKMMFHSLIHDGVLVLAYRRGLRGIKHFAVIRERSFPPSRP